MTELFKGDWSGVAGQVPTGILAEEDPLPALCKGEHWRGNQRTALLGE